MPRIFVLAASLVVALPAFAAPDAAQLLQKAKAAAGGSAWDDKRTLHERGKMNVGGIDGESDDWSSLVDGRAYQSYHLGMMNGANGFDGKVAWQQDTSKQVKLSQDVEGKQDAANGAYVSALAYFFPARHAAEVSYVAERSEGGRRFHVLAIVPAGGRRFELWLDAATLLIDRTVDHSAIETRTTFWSDYRDVAGVKVAFAWRSTNGESKYDQTGKTTSVEFNVPLDDKRFAPPGPPPRDFAIDNSGGTSGVTTVPFQLVNNHIYVDVMLDGKGPFPMLCDTGGANIITPEVQKTLGLTSEGKLQGRGVGEKSEDISITKLREIKVGGATLRDQMFMVFPMAPFAAVEGVTENGLIGYEVFKRFVVAIDYEKKQLTLMLPEKYTPDGRGTTVPFTLAGTIPQVDGSLDGIAGKFDIDTGSRASVDVMGPFVADHKLVDKYHPAVEGVTGWGIGGPARSQVTRGKSLMLGGVAVKAPILSFSTQQKGAFINRFVAGNIGNGVLGRFNLVFDYGHSTIVFTPNANDRAPDVFDRAGLWVNRGEGGFDVVDVMAGAPAAQAGLHAGDRIVAVDGKPAATLTLPELRRRFRGTPGTTIALTVGGKTPRELKLTLRELVP